MNKLIKTDRGYVAVSDEEIQYNPSGGINGNFICLSEIAMNKELGPVLIGEFKTFKNEKL